MRAYTRAFTGAGAVALALALAACGSTSSTSSGSMPGMSGMAPASTSPVSGSGAAVDAQHNAADVTFAQQMIVHHQGAIQMAELAGSRSASTQVKDLAARIKAAQDPEITQMTGWLTTWGQPVATASSMAGMDHSTGSGGMTPGPAMGGAMGMMTDAQMKELTAATGTAFDRMFLQLMTIHHNGAIDMAKTEQATGSNPQAIALAKSIQTSQSAEVTQMSKLLATL